MDQVTDYYPDLEPDEGPFQTRVWVTGDGRKEVGKLRGDAKVLATFRSRANKGFQGYVAPALRSEGAGIWGFGGRKTTARICGFFVTDTTREHFVICGAWKGKAGPGSHRPHHAEAIAARTEKIRNEGVVTPEGTVLRVS